MDSAQSIPKNIGTPRKETSVRPRCTSGSPGGLFGELLISKGLVDRKDLVKVLNEQREQGGRLGEVLLRLKMLNEQDVTAALAEHFSMEYIHFNESTKMDMIDMDVARLLPESIAKRFCLVAIGKADDKVVVVMADPLNVIALDTVTLKLKSQNIFGIKPAISSTREIERAIELIYHGSDVEEQQLRDLVSRSTSGEIETETKIKDDVYLEDIIEPDASGETEANKAPVIRFVDLLLSQAVKSRASDIHVEPQENSMAVRMRIDGVLRNMVPPGKKMQAAVIARIKIIARLDIAERRLPQDGRFKIKVSGRNVDVRVSTIPTIYGEKVVMRILDASSVNHDLNRLGLEANLLEEFEDMLSRPNGIIIVTGPTGSGKSTTLYSALSYLKDPTKNITTVEDPVEYRLAGINQIQIRSEINLSFAKCLRAILRQDPDIILIGEIRDTETAEIAIKASLTGHLVLSTFHTNDAPSAISRLLYMGAERYLLASALNLVIAQRLVRKICEHCKEPVTLSNEVLKRLGIDQKQAADSVFYHGRGCSNCGGTGYLGRLPIFEFLVLDEEISERIIAGDNEAQIRAASRKKGYGGLFESGVNKALQGLTTAEEIISVAYTGKK
jgi:type IV pilus assembly protein PilB